MGTSAQNVCVIGLGYIGLPTASLLATKGFSVAGCDVNEEVVNTINRGEIHIVEKELDILVRSAVHSGMLKAYTTPQVADVFIIAVPTPFCDNHKPDVRYVEAAVRAMAPVLKNGNLVILESTSPVGTTENIARILQEMRPDLDNEALYIAHCPERVLPGQIIRELVDNDRIVGGTTPTATARASHFYQQFVTGNILQTNARTAEMAKLSENAFRDVNIAFANELSIICDKIGISVWELIKLANCHPRVNILQPGPGVGGHCIAVDPWFIVDSAPAEARLIRTAREVNTDKTHRIIAQIQKQANRFKQPIIACLGLSYKANIDDLRESPALDIATTLAQNHCGALMIVEPHIDELPPSLAQHQHVELTTLESALSHSDIIVVLVDHHDFIGIDPQKLAQKTIIDTRGLWQ